MLSFMSLICSSVDTLNCPAGSCQKQAFSVHLRTQVREKNSSEDLPSPLSVPFTTEKERAAKGFQKKGYRAHVFEKYFRPGQKIGQMTGGSSRLCYERLMINMKMWERRGLKLKMVNIFFETGGPKWKRCAESTLKIKSCIRQTLSITSILYFIYDYSNCTYCVLSGR